MEEKKAGKLKIGWIVGAVLTVITLVEYYVAITLQNNLPYLAIAGFGKAALIVYYFMHVSQIWDEGGDH